MMGAPENHWFGPADDHRWVGIGTIESMQMVWSCHREIVSDLIVADDWVQPKKMLEVVTQEILLIGLD